MFTNTKNVTLCVSGNNPPQTELKDGQMPERLGIDSGAENVVYGLSSNIGLIIGAILGWVFKVSSSRKFYGYFIFTVLYSICKKQTVSNCLFLIPQIVRGQ